MTQFQNDVNSISPPWLLRPVGRAIVRGMAKAFDDLSERLGGSIALRFPSASRPEALTKLGVDRVIIRGPSEPSSAFATRLQTWWESHQTRGNAYALLSQLNAYLVGLLDAQAQVTEYANNGRAHYVLNTATGGIFRFATVSTSFRDSTSNWSRFVIAYELGADSVKVPQFDGNGKTVIDSGGEPVLTTKTLSALTAAELDLFCVIPRAWSAAHIDKIYVSVAPPGAVFYGQLSAQYGNPGLVYGGSATARFVEC